MSLDLLERELAKAEYHYKRRPDGTLLWPFQGQFALHPLIITEEGRYLRASVRFPAPVVVDLPGLCKSLNAWVRRLEDTAQVLLTDSNQLFDLSMRSLSDELTASAGLLVAFADDVYSLLEYLRLGNSVAWNSQLVGLAFLDPAECHGQA